MSDTPITGAADTAASTSPGADVGGDALTMPDGQQLFPREYVSKLRDEAANYRTQLREIEQQANRYEVFNEYDDDDREVWIDLARSWQADPYQAAETMRTIASRVLGDIEQGQASDEFYDDMQEAQDNYGGVTPEQVQQIVQAEMSRQMAVQEMESMIDGVYGEIRQAGIEPNSMDGYMVLWRASNETNGDVAQAVAAHNAYKQEIVDGYVKSKTAGSAPLVPNGTQGVQTQQPASLDDAFKQAREFLRNSNMMG
jgi:hypothetical protein